MKRPAELDDWDRDSVMIKAHAILAKYQQRPMGATKRIPSPYTNAEPPKVVKRTTDGAMVAFCCFAMIGAMLTIVGGVQVVRWIVEAVR